MQETWVQSLGQEDPLEEGMATHSSILAWRIPWREEPGGLQPMGSKRVGHDWATEHASTEDQRVLFEYMEESHVDTLFLKWNCFIYKPIRQNWNWWVEDRFKFNIEEMFYSFGDGPDREWTKRIPQMHCFIPRRSLKNGSVWLCRYDLMVVLTPTFLDKGSFPMLLTAACLGPHPVQQKGFLVPRSKPPCVQSARCSLVKWDLHLIHRGIILLLCPSRFQQITGPVTSVTKEAALCQSKAGPAVLVLCEPGAQRFPRNLLPSLGRRVGQQLLLQLQSCALSLPSSSIWESKCSPWRDLLQGGGKRTLKEGDTRTMITARWPKATKSRKQSMWKLRQTPTSPSFSLSEQHYP